MKKSINAWSVPGGVPFAEMFRQLAAAGFEGVELNLDGDNGSLHALTENTTAAEAAEIRRMAAENGLAIAGVSTSLGGRDPLGSDDPAVRARGMDLILRQAELAANLGTDCILAAPGGHGGAVSLLQAHENVTAALTELAPQLEKMGISVGLENVWNGFFLSPFDMVRMIDAVNSPSVGAYFDAGNVAAYSDPSHWAEILGHRIKRMHLKDFKRGRVHSGEFANLLEGCIPWPALMQMLRRIGYDGYLTAELDAIPNAPEFLYAITSHAMDILLAL